MAQNRKATQKVRLAPRRISHKPTKGSDQIGAEDMAPQYDMVAANSQGTDCTAPRISGGSVSTGDWAGVFTGSPRDPLKEKSLLARVKDLEQRTNRGDGADRAEAAYIYQQVRNAEENAHRNHEALLARIENLEIVVAGKIQGDS